jgi:lipoate-protein ligase A
MALDEAIWRARLAGESPPTLRFFAWDPPTISVGYGQRLDAGLDLTSRARLGVGLVRRPTGGSAIYHDGPDRELTYSVVAGVEDFAGADDLLEAYRWIARALLEGLLRLQVPAEMVAVMPSSGPQPAFCFARTGSYEIEAGGKKLVGSAQRRQPGGFLQHGSVMLGADAIRLRTLFPGDSDPLRWMTTIEESSGRRPAFDEVAHALSAGFTAVHGIALAPAGLTPGEERLVHQLVHQKYGTAEWNEHAQLVRDLSRIS